MKMGILRRDMAATLSEAVSRFKLDDSARLGGPDSGSSTSESSESEELAAQAKFNSEVPKRGAGNRLHPFSFKLRSNSS